MRKFYVTLNKATSEYLHANQYEEVNADDVVVGGSGELAFFNEDGSIAVVYAPGVWVLFTESVLKNEDQAG